MDIGKAGIQFTSGCGDDVIGYIAISGLIKGTSDIDMCLFANTGSALLFCADGSATEKMAINTSGSVTISSYVTLNDSTDLGLFSRDTNGLESLKIKNLSSGNNAQAYLGATSTAGSVALQQYSHTNAMDYGGLTAVGMSMLFASQSNGLLIEEYNNAPIYFATNDSVKLWLLGSGYFGA